MPCPILTRETQTQMAIAIAQDCDRAGELLDTTEKQPDSEDVRESVAIDVSPVVNLQLTS